MKKRALLRLLALVFLLHLPAALRADTPVKVGLYQNKPLAFMDDAGTPGGIYVDILQTIAAKEGWRLEYVSCTWAACLELLERGDLDLLVAIAYSAERADRFE
ncbi:MAG: transporter substrate-binding domain-containing protein, partial [Anaerolineae bacterium]